MARLLGNWWCDLSEIPEQSCEWGVIRANDFNKTKSASARPGKALGKSPYRVIEMQDLYRFRGTSGHLVTTEIEIICV